MFISQGLLSTPSLILYSSKNRLKTSAIRAPLTSNSDARSTIDCSPAILQNENTVEVVIHIVPVCHAQSELFSVKCNELVLL